jgi:uncharacterized protein YycO
MITLKFSRADGVVSRLIAWFNFGQFSHVAIQLADGSIIEALATPNAVVCHRRDDYPVTVTVTMPCPAKDEAVAWLLEQVGKPYDFSGIGGFLTRRDWQKPERWFCSELAAAFCERAGLGEILVKKGRISPTALFQMLSFVPGRALS